MWDLPFSLNQYENRFVVGIQPKCPLLFPQVKIWFQNKRSKFKKIIKQGRGTLETATQMVEQGLTATTTSLPSTSVWNSYLTTSYADSTETPMVSYVSEYSSWYQTAHQEETQHTQLL